MNMKKMIYTILGGLGLGLGILGTVLPILPTVPFLMIAAYCFARSSKKLNDWFIHTKLYKDNFESYVAGKVMTRKTKVRIMITITVLMSVGFVIMHAVPVGRIILSCVWVSHILYFTFGIKTLKV